MMMILVFVVASLLLYVFKPLVPILMLKMRLGR